MRLLQNAENLTKIEFNKKLNSHKKIFSILFDSGS